MTSLTATLDRLLELSALIAADQARFEHDQGLSGPRIHLLWVLGTAGPSTQHSLAAALGVTPRHVTGLVDSLVADGHVTREAHPTDRRARVVTPTARGRALVVDLRRSHERLAGQLFGALPPDRLEVFGAVLDETAARFAALMEQQEERR